jgi:hypothetical protein
MQFEHSGASARENDPGLQLRHAGDDEPEYFPAGQIVQSTEYAALNFPFGQTWQDDDDTPTDVYDPASQILQRSNEANVAYWPTGQSTHDS